VIFCRNVLIYFDRQTVEEIIRHMHSVLQPGGYLFLGVCESLFQLSAGFELVSAAQAFVYRRIEGGARPAAAAVPVRREEARRVARPPLRRLDAPPPALPPLPPAPEPPPPVDARLAHALDAADRGAIEEARGWLEALLDEQPMEPRAHFLRGVLLYRMGADLEALTALRRLVYLETGFAMGHFYLGLVQERLGMPELARRSFRNARDAATRTQAAPKDLLLAPYLLPSDALAEACRVRLDVAGGDRR